MELDLPRIRVIAPLRGIAVAIVVSAHILAYPGSQTGIVGVGRDCLVLKDFAFVGVSVFFVISGFVIPYSLERADYQVQDFPRFMARRLVRLDPPYLCTIALVLAMWFVAARVAPPGPNRYHASVMQVLLHLGYLNEYFGYPYIVGAFWTLTVEFQFYVAMGLAFPLLTRARQFWLFATPLALIAAWSNPIYLAAYLPQFLVGIAAFHARTRRLKDYEFLLVVGLVSGFQLFIFNSVFGAAAMILASGSIVFYNGKTNRALAWFGTISYPLYLVHSDVGWGVMRVVQRVVPAMPIVMLPLIAVASALGAAVVLHRWIELPAQIMASRIAYRHPPRVLVAAPTHTKKERRHM